MMTKKTAEQELMDELDWCVEHACECRDECRDTGDGDGEIEWADHVVELARAVISLRCKRALTDDEKDALESELINMSDKDFVAESRAMRRAVNLLMHRIGRLERFNPHAIVMGGPLPTCTINGEKWYALI